MQRFAEGYPLAGALVTVCTDLDGADAVGLDTPVHALTPCKDKTTAYVFGLMSTGAATVAVVVILYDEDGANPRIAAPGAQTATALTYRESASSGDYHTQALAFDLGGAAKYEVRSADASAGTRTLVTWAV